MDIGLHLDLEVPVAVGIAGPFGLLRCPQVLVGVLPDGDPGFRIDDFHVRRLGHPKILQPFGIHDPANDLVVVVVAPLAGHVGIAHALPVLGLVPRADKPEVPDTRRPASVAQIHRERKRLAVGVVGQADRFRRHCVRQGPHRLAVPGQLRAPRLEFLASLVFSLLDLAVSLAVAVSLPPRLEGPGHPVHHEFIVVLGIDRATLGRQQHRPPERDHAPEDSMPCEPHQPGLWPRAGLVPVGTAVLP